MSAVYTAHLTSVALVVNAVVTPRVAEPVVVRRRPALLVLAEALRVGAGPVGVFGIDIVVVRREGQVVPLRARRRADVAIDAAGNGPPQRVQARLVAQPLLSLLVAQRPGLHHACRHAVAVV